MFYSQCLVSRKGSLGAIRVAAYFFKKLKKAQVKDTHIPSSVDQILQKELDALTYRVLAYLLLGVVRIYSKKVDFLFDDCQKAMISVKAFVDKEKKREKTEVALPSSPACFSIVLPASFELDAFDLGILEDFHGDNVKSQEDITLKDGGRETESMELYSTERFDMEEDLLLAFHETFSASHSETKHESITHDMDIDEENVRGTTGEEPDRVAEEKPLDSNESSRVQQNAYRQRENPASDDMAVEPQMSEDMRRTQEEDTVRETICTIVQNLVDLDESAGDNLHKDVQSYISESEKSPVETSMEKMRHDVSLLSECGRPEASQGNEEQPSDATRAYEKKEIPEMSTLEESEPGSVTNVKDFPEGIEPCRDNSEVEMMDFEMFQGSSETSKVNPSGSERAFSSDMTVSKDSDRGFNTADTPAAVTPKPPSRLRISEGETSPHFTIIPTPAAKESSRISRKRKCLIDDEVIIPNKVMKKMIEDSSSLISKRRYLPHTDSPGRRTRRFGDPSRSFLDPLIPYGSLVLQSLFCHPIKIKNPGTTGTSTDAGRKKKSSLGTLRIPGVVLSSEQTENAQEIMETPQASALAGLKVTVGNGKEVSVEVGASSITSGTAHQTENAAESLVNPSVIAPETPVRRSEQTEIAPETPVVSERVEIAPETPVRESTSIRFFNDPETCAKDTRSVSPFTSYDEHPPVSCVEGRDLDAILMNEEQANAGERDDLQHDTWSARTRKVAKFLEKTFSEHREREEEEKVSLLQLCKGRTRKENARLFYETLVLKTKGFLQGKQDQPYGDVLLTLVARQQEAC